ncbi:hypothetical protein LX70_01679 [Defluviimonas denitrificans]|jgi:hypothetical protein|uniref:Uncharacterized protein n=1 Tax=Albidovulum denitrificans TaxID=404881 RepID=A0A2S8SAT7_9RHOB|nr:hypothetical protein [Defluviimonas denitrificans]PQV57869.1 hypothetical protein LX70_01679 [Defluviimonas denitrificans]
MKALAVSQSSLGASIFSAPSFLRIAIPSWRAIGIGYRPDGDATESLSREEIQRLFHGDLDPWARKRPPLTDREKQEKSLADKMRAALYPDPASRH